MKVDRLIGIITTLQRRGKTTAPYLAHKFEVSRRTINRDIEAICKAGIPIVTTRGKHGGISIMEGFNLDTTVFTQDELTAIFAGLTALDSVSSLPQGDLLAAKLSGAESLVDIDASISIDLASFYKGSLSEKISLLKRAIDGKRRVSFRYYYSKGVAQKQIEPYRIVFKWYDWYMYGFCVDRQAFRMFKLNRLWNLSLDDDVFTPRPLPEETQRYGGHITDDYSVTAIYDESEKYRLVEEYGPDCYTSLADGRLFTEWKFSGIEAAVDWLIGFGDRVEVVEPREVRQRIRRIAQNILDKG